MSSKAMEELGKTLRLWDSLVRDPADRLLFGRYYRWESIDGKLRLIPRFAWKQQRMAEIYAEPRELTLTGRSKADKSWIALQLITSGVIRDDDSA
jgi:hypothetical protein